MMWSFMRLPRPSDNLQAQLSEFDIWITPSLGEISTTDRFRNEVDSISNAIEVINDASSCFENSDDLQPAEIASSIVVHLKQYSTGHRQEILNAIAGLMFASTGKSDNNFKCQFPLFLRDSAHIDKIPQYKRHGKSSLVVTGPIPRELRSDRYMATIAHLKNDLVSSGLLEQFISFLLRDLSSRRQFWALGRSYLAMKTEGRHRDFLAPIVTFKVRGSVMASGGHEPEERLRLLLADWGLQPGIDYNESDAVPDIVETAPGAKSRAFDCILPFRTSGWNTRSSPRLLIQCQFYAGDSGSVSHKNVDQARASRDDMVRWLDQPWFIEFVDGAGYFSSLNGDLRKLLAFGDTAGLIQLRTAPVRLRAYLDEIGFVTPLKVEQSVAFGAVTSHDVVRSLTRIGFSSTEVERAYRDSVDRSFIRSGHRGLTTRPDRRELIRRYVLLDHAASLSQKVDQEDVAGKLLIPGYGPHQGVDVDVLASSLAGLPTIFKGEYRDATTVRADIDHLASRGFVIVYD